MKIKSLFYLSLQSLKNRKSRILFTILGVSVGIGAILFLVSLGYGLQKLILEKITTTESLLTLDVAPTESKVVTLNDKTLKEISEIDGVEKVSPQAIIPGQTSLDKITSEVVTNLVNPEFFSLGGTTPDIGRSFNTKDSQKIVINSSLAELFDLKPEEILGKKLKFSLFLSQNKGDSEEIEVLNPEKEFEIVGVIKETGAQAQVYLKRSDLSELEINEYQFVKVKVHNNKAMENVREKLIGMGFLVSALSDTVSQTNKIFTVVQIVLGSFGIVALIVSAIGLVNTMTISLLERTNEIGIMQAIGASSSDIRNLFLGESFLIGFLGGAGGIVLGEVGAWIFNGFVNILARTLGGEPTHLFYSPLWFLIFIIFLSSFVGLLSGFWPARRASKMDPLDALRYK